MGRDFILTRYVTRQYPMSLRHENRRRLTATDLDVLVVGGGINGASAAAALAARGVGTALPRLEILPVSPVRTRRI